MSLLRVFPLLLVLIGSSACKKVSAVPPPAAPVAAAPATTAAGDDWPQFLGPNQDDTSPATGLLETLPPGGPRVVWEREVGTGYAAPSVRHGQLVLHHRRGNSEIVEAFDAAT